MKSILSLVLAVNAGKWDQKENFDRYNAIIKMMKHYTPGFDELKYFQYGCHCIIRADQLNLHGIGKPVDALDNACRKFKNCLKCVKRENGKECTDQNTVYSYRLRKKGNNFVSSNKKGTCERDTFNCDHQFAQDLSRTVGNYTEKFHQFLGPFDNTDYNNCVSAGAADHDPGCCGGRNRAWTLYNKLGTSQCCKDGSVKNQC